MLCPRIRGPPFLLFYRLGRADEQDGFPVHPRVESHQSGSKQIVESYTLTQVF
jgi:hypothetical protein